MLPSSDQLSLVHVGTHILVIHFLFNVAKDAADPWYLQQTGKQRVKVRLVVVVRDVSDWLQSKHQPAVRFPEPETNIS